jgi:subtilisin family serine protease
MKNYLVLLLALALFCSACSSGKSSLDQPTDTAVASTGTATGSQRYIVGLAAPTGKGTSTVSRMTAQLRTQPDIVFDQALTGFAGELTTAEAAQLKADPQVAFVEPDIKLHTTLQTLGWGVNRIDADLNLLWKSDGGGAGVGVAVFDTGIQSSHPDLAGAGYLL